MMLAADFSAYQARVDWKTLVAWRLPGREPVGITLATIKATQGTDYIDPRYLPYMNGAKDNGLRVGVYHFFDWRVDPIEQANYFLTTAGGAAHVWNPDWANPWLDAETLDEGSIPAADLLASMAVFCETVEAETHRIVGVYVSPSFWRDRLDNPVNWTRHPLWIADYGVTAPPNIGGWTGYTMWQWTSTADVDGVFPGPLDLSWYTPDPAWLPELV